MVLERDLWAALTRLNPDLPESAREQAIDKIKRIDFARSLIQHNRECYGFIRGGVPVGWRDASGETRHAHAHVIDFRDATRNRFLAVRELKIQGVRVPHYNRRSDLVCFVNGLPLFFIELKAVYRDIRANPRFVRWQGHTVAQLGFVNNTVLALTTASLGFAVSSLQYGSTIVGYVATTRRLWRQQ